ncbi:MAG: protein kinase, partial [candidate division Zixibacteria bacterium]|nr:protein kinase [candidate division Zixibacteria bacterium]
MSQQRFNKIQELFEAALELGRADREAWLQKECGTDSELFNEVNRMLRADQQSHSLLDGLALDVVSSESAWPGQEGVVGHYSITEELGSGGMGQVYLAEDTRLKRLVALKFLPAHVASDQMIRARFLREAQAAAMLIHPNIVTIHEISEIDGRPYIVMEHLAGRSLDEMLEHDLLDGDVVSNTVIQICRGLQKAHDQGVVHRDIKPGNVIVGEDGLAKLLDFGIARIIGESQLTRTGTAPGTANYMSPEQARGEECDHRSDIFSIGALMYQMLSGRAPFARANVAATINAIVYDEPEVVTKLNSDVPGYLWDITRRALQKRADDRYQSVSDLAADLEAQRPAMPTPAATLPVQASVAVFPFRFAGDDAEIDYLADGICEDIIARLSKLERLKVASRTAVFRFKGKEYDPFEIARELGVNHVLGGSIRRHEETIRINIEMTSVDDQAVLWSESYDRTIADVLQLQADVAEQVAAALNVTLSGNETQLIERKPTVDPKAYDCFLRGRYYMKKRDQTSVEKAIRLLNEAARLDSSFAEAHAQLAAAHSLHQTYGYGRPEGVTGEAVQLATRAVELEPGSSDAHMALFLVIRSEDLGRGITELRTAVALNPGNNEAHHYLAHAYVLSGRYRLAAEHEETALQLDPFQEISRAHLCRIYFYQDEQERSDEVMRKLLANDRRGFLGSMTEGSLAWYRRRWAQAAASLEKARAVEANNVHLLYYLADCYLRLGEADKAESILSEGLKRLPDRYPLHQKLGQVLRSSSGSFGADKQFQLARQGLDENCSVAARERSAVYHYDTAMLLATNNMPDQAIEHLRRGVDCGLGHYADFESRPDWDNLRDQPDFQHVVDDLRRAAQDHTG